MFKEELKLFRQCKKSGGGGPVEVGVRVRVDVIVTSYCD